MEESLRQKLQKKNFEPKEAKKESESMMIKNKGYFMAKGSSIEGPKVI